MRLIPLHAGTGRPSDRARALAATLFPNCARNRGCGPIQTAPAASTAAANAWDSLSMP